MLNRVMVILAAVLLAVLGVALTNDKPAEAVQPSFICEALDSGKIDTVGDPATVEVTAPEGKLISGYCVKAGTEKFFIPVVPPQKTVIVDHPVKDSVSHYSLTYIPAPTPTTSPTPTPSPTETPEETPSPTPTPTMDLPTLPLPEDPPGDNLAETGPAFAAFLFILASVLTSAGLALRFLRRRNTVV